MKKLNYDVSQKFQKGAIALALVASFLTACGTGRETTEEPTTTSQTEVEQPIERAEESNVILAELPGNVDQYVGRNISVRGDVEREVGKTAFLIQSDRGEDVLVINATGQPFVLPTGNPVSEQIQVTGGVAKLVIADIEREYGLDLDPNLFVEYEDRPVIIAQSIALAPQPEEITENPDPYFNKVIAVPGQIARKISPTSFTIQDDPFFAGEQVLVISREPVPALEPQEEVVVTGVLRPYDAAAFERDYNLGWAPDLRQKIEAEYTKNPVFIAEEVYPSATKD